MITAITLIALYLGAAAAYLLWAMDTSARGLAPGWLWAGVPLIWIAIPFGSAAFSFVLAWIFRSPRPPERRIGFAATRRLYVNEAVAMAKSQARMAIGWWSMRDPPPQPAECPVLLLHGVLCNAGTWRGVMPKLAARGIGPIYTLTYGPPQASIELFAEQLAAKIDAIRAATGAIMVTLVAHSMGGLVARAYMRRHGADCVRGLVALGTPYHGSVHAWLFPGVCLAQIRPGSAWLAELNRDEGAPLSARTVSLWSWHDSMVAPQKSAQLASARNIEVVGVGHNALLDDSGVIALLAAEIEAVR